MEQFLKDWWSVIVAVIAFAVWLVRLEYRANQNTRDVANLERRLAEQRREDNELRARDWAGMTKQLAALSEKVDRIPEHIIALLRSTK
ncbi:hypothetical protein OA50_04457 [Mameliella alba]|uniref:Uncharacterized protein n=2 Tax=Mameliella alba TaxID=561184 RepID=A0A0B3S323_9RHOB|nr:hypothetical protein OA50_04457 [Mameliella alba]